MSDKSDRTEMKPKLIFCCLIFGGNAIAGKQSHTCTGRELLEYVSEKEPRYSWEVVASKTNSDKSVVYELKLASQTWRDIPWNHRLRIVIPANIIKGDTRALLMIAGDSGGEDELAFISRIAGNVGAPAAVLHDVPNQPLYDGLEEDALIAATFMDFITNGRPSNLLLFPMAKSAVKAMDAMAEFCKTKLKIKIDEYVTCGASKRGWTTWLSAVVDKRVKAIAPMVYDNLNLKKQMELQLSDFGEFSEQIAEYTELHIPEMMMSNVPNAVVIGKLVDPFAYIDKLTVPKLIILGTNDRYWPLDAINVYFDKLPGKNYVHYVPNTGHDLGGKTERVEDTLSAFFRNSSSLPEIHTLTRRKKGKIEVEVKISQPPKTVRLWTACSDTRDFRNAVWSSRPMKKKESLFVLSLKQPSGKFTALFPEAAFCQENQMFRLTSNVVIIDKKEK